MTTVLMILGWINANPGSASMIAGGVLSVASAAFEAAGMTKTSKVLGTFTIDAGRITRYAKLALEAAHALRGK
jgi:hypothetical protein